MDLRDPMSLMSPRWSEVVRRADPCVTVCVVSSLCDGAKLVCPCAVVSPSPSNAGRPVKLGGGEHALALRIVSAFESSSWLRAPNPSRGRVLSACHQGTSGRQPSGDLGMVRRVISGSCDGWLFATQTTF